MTQFKFPDYDATFKTGYKCPQQFTACTPLARLDWFNLFEPQQPDPQKNELKEAEYNATLLFDPAADFSVLKEISHDAKVKKFGADQAKWPDLKGAIKDQGKITKPKAWHVAGAGMVTIKAGVKSVEMNGKPVLLGIDGKPITDTSALYRGCIVRAIVRAYGYDYKSKSFGVSLGLVGIQKIADADPFFERVNVQEAFAPVQAPAAQVGTGAGAGGLFD